jgi:PemK-like, MazF-like toxin of type II toxin-antitoxin system
MAIPTPEVGLVISYYEHQAGREEGRKDRPCVIALAVEQRNDSTIVVTVLPITHRQPVDPADAVEIPAAVKRHIGLDDNRSWVVVD